MGEGGEEVEEKRDRGQSGKGEESNKGCKTGRIEESSKQKRELGTKQRKEQEQGPGQDGGLDSGSSELRKDQGSGAKNRQYEGP